MTAAVRAVVVCDDYRTKPMPVEKAEALVAAGNPHCQCEHRIEIVK